MANEDGGRWLIESPILSKIEQKKFGVIPGFEL
jgi:hypothetical protein